MSRRPGMLRAAPLLAMALLKAVIWAAAALALAVGVPWALVHFVGNPLPAVVPSWNELTFAFTKGQIDAWTWVKFFSLVAWFAWADLAAGFAAELVTSLRGRTIGPRRGLGAARWFAGRVIGQWALVASLVVHTAAPSALASLPSAAAPAVALMHTSPTTVAVHSLTSALAPVGAAAPGAGPGREVGVGRRDTLWGLSEQHLGSGARWEVLRDANVGRVMPDGTVLSPEFTRLEAGWRLLIPATASSGLSPATAPVELGAASDGTVVAGDEPDRFVPASEVEVRHGDNLWRLSQGRLSQAAPNPAASTVAGYVDDVAALNRTAVHDPDLIYPGQVLAFPAVGEPASEAAGHEVPPADPGSRDGVGDGVGSGVDGTPDDEARLIEADASDRDGLLSTATEVAAPVAIEIEDPAGRDAGEVRPAGETIPLGAGGALLAAGALELVRRRRRYRLAHRRPFTVPVAPGRDLEGIERALNRHADQATMRWLNAALSSLAARPVWEGEKVAQPVLARLDEEHLDVRFSQPDLMAAPIPWTTVDGGISWQLARTVPADDLPAQAASNTAPTLVSVGQGIMVNLEAVGVLAVSGPADLPFDLARSIVHELATSPAAGLIDIRTTFPIEGTDTYSLVRVAPANDLAAELTPWLSDADRQQEQAQAANAYAYRLTGDREPISPVVILADDASRADLAPLAAAAACRRLPLAIVLVGTSDPSVDHRIELDQDGRAHLLPWDVTVRAQGLSATVARQLGRLLVDAAAVAHEPLLSGIRLSASVTELRHRPSPADVITEPGSEPGPEARSDLLPDRGDSAVDLDLGHPGPAEVVSEASGRGEGSADMIVEATQVVDAAEIVDAAEVTAEPAESGAEVAEAGGSTSEVLPGLLAGDAPMVAPEPIVVRVLGPVEAEGLAVELTSQQLSLLCYLACNGPSTRGSLIDALWDGQVISQSRFPNLLAELRARIGRHHFPEARDGRYELVAVSTDLDQLEHAIAVANRQDTGSAIETLRAALTTVRGVPLTVPGPRFWSWVGDQTHFAARVESTVADTAARLARLEQQRGHLDGARWACDQGLLASPTDETLVTVLTEIYMAAGKPGLARRLVDGWEDRISRMECGEPSDEPRKRLAG